MGLFGFLGEVTSATVKVVVTPVAILSDVTSIAIGIEPDSTKNHVKSIGKDLSNSVNEILP